MAWTLAQPVVSATSGQSSATRDYVFGSNVTASDLLVAQVASFNAAITWAVTDSQGNTWVQAGGYVVAAAGVTDRLSVWYTVAGSTGPCTVHLTPNSAAYLTASVYDYSGGDPVPFRAVSSASGTSASPSPGAVAALAGDLVFTAFNQGTANLTSATVASPFTARYSNLSVANEGVGTADHLSASGSETPLWTLSNSVNWGAIGVAFKAGTGGGGTAGNASGARPAVSAKGTTGAATGAASASPARPSLSLGAPAGSASGGTSVAGNASGTRPALSASAPSGAATGAASIPFRFGVAAAGKLSLVAPAGAATGGTSVPGNASGAPPALSARAPTGSATGGSAASALAAVLRLAAPAGAARAVVTLPEAYLRQAVLAALAAGPGVSAVVGTNVFPARVPEDDRLPAVTAEVVSNVRGKNLSGHDGTATAKVRVTSLSRTYRDGEALAVALKDLLDGFRGVLAGLVTVLWCVQADESDRSDEPADGSDRALFSTSSLYAIRYREPTPNR